MKEGQKGSKKDGLFKDSSKLNFEEDRRLVLEMKKVIVLSTVLGLGALGMACGDAAPANNAANANRTNTNVTVTNANAANAAANAANTVANAAANAANAVANAANSAANAAKPANTTSNTANANKPANAKP